MTIRIVVFSPVEETVTVVPVVQPVSGEDVPVPNLGCTQCDQSSVEVVRNKCCCHILDNVHQSKCCLLVQHSCSHNGKQVMIFDGRVPTYPQQHRSDQPQRRLQPHPRFKHLLGCPNLPNPSPLHPRRRRLLTPPRQWEPLKKDK